MSLDKKISITHHTYNRDESEDQRREFGLPFSSNIRQGFPNKPPIRELRKVEIQLKHAIASKAFDAPTREASNEHQQRNRTGRQAKMQMCGQKSNENLVENQYKNAHSRSREPAPNHGLHSPQIFVEGTIIKPFAGRQNESQHKFSIIRAHRQTKVGLINVQRGYSGKQNSKVPETPSQRLISIPEESNTDQKTNRQKYSFVSRDQGQLNGVINQIVHNIIGSNQGSKDKKQIERPVEQLNMVLFKNGIFNQPNEPIKQVAPKFKIKSLMRTPSKRPNNSSDNLPASSEKEVVANTPLTLSNTELVGTKTTIPVINKKSLEYFAYVSPTVLDNCETNLEKLFTEFDDLRYYVLNRQDQPFKGLEVTEFIFSGLVFYSYDFKNFKSSRMTIHHLSSVNFESQLILLQKTEEAIFTSSERSIDEIFYKVKHKRVNNEYLSISKEVTASLKQLGWQWKMVLNELDARYTIFWKKRDCAIYGQPNDICQESFKVIFSGFLSNDPGLVFLNKRESSSESFFCSELMGFFANCFEDKLCPTEKHSSKVTSSSLLIKSQVDDMRGLNAMRPDSQNYKNLPQKSSNDISNIDGFHLAREHTYEETVTSRPTLSPRQNLRIESCRGKAPEPSPLEGEVLLDYTDVKLIDNSPQLASAIDTIFKVKVRDKHLKKLHFQTQNRFLSILATFRLALRLPQIAPRAELLNNKPFKLLRLAFFARVETSGKGSTVYLINTLEPNFKLFVCKADTNSSDESLRRAVNHLENCLNAQEDAATETGFIWVPQFSKASMLDYFGQSEDVRSFCKFEISLSQDIGDNAVLCTPKPTDLKIKSDYLLGIIKLCSKENHLSIVATFKISKPNFI